ncbi:MAG: AraC family transcriptional regulator [Ruminococcaceae bacterium]|nr:AraC family transcriptional regulator [Oscillospiraceae bacterium]
MEFDFINDIIKCIAGFEFKTLNNSPKDIFDHINQKNQNFINYFYKNPDDLLHLCSLRPNCIYEFNSFFGVAHILFYSKETSKVYSLGPLLHEPFSEYQALEKIHKIGIPADLSRQLLMFGASLPVIPTSTLNRLSLLLYQKITGSNVPISFQTVNLFKENVPNLLESPVHLTSASIREIEERYELSAALTEAVKQGNFSMAINILSKYNFSGAFSHRNSSPLRNFQNYCIILNTQLRHALEECHIHPYQLDRISNNIGIKIEQLDSLKKAESLTTEILKSYCRLVQENAYPNLKPLVHLAVTHIKDHLSDNISVKETAAALNVNANYLSTIFQKEMGISFIDFVNKERITQAAKLLKCSTLQIQQIAFTVGFNNTSYFAKQFQKHYGKSPREYRN